MKNWEIIDGEHTRKVMWINHEIEMKLYYNGEDEIDEDLIEFVKNYEKEDRPEVLELLSKYKGKDIHIFHTRKDAKTYLESLK